MEYTTLGRTGLRVSVAGLGCGGNSRVGLGSGKSESECVALVHAAMDLGVNYLDTAQAYGNTGVHFLRYNGDAVPNSGRVVLSGVVNQRGSIFREGLKTVAPGFMTTFDLRLFNGTGGGGDSVSIARIVVRCPGRVTRVGDVPRRLRCGGA